MCVYIYIYIYMYVYIYIYILYIYIYIYIYVSMPSPPAAARIRGPRELACLITRSALDVVQAASNLGRVCPAYGKACLT